MSLLVKSLVTEIFREGEFVKYADFAHAFVTLCRSFSGYFCQPNSASFDEATMRTERGRGSRDAVGNRPVQCLSPAFPMLSCHLF